MSAEADPKNRASAPQEPPRPEGPKRFPPPELRLHDRKAFVGFGHTPLGEGIALTDLALIVPEVSFPFDITGSAATRYQRTRCRFGYLELRVDNVVVDRAVAQIQKACAAQVASLALELRPDLIEGRGELHGPEAPVPFTFRVGFEPHGAQLVAVIFDVRIYGPSPLPAPGVASLLARAAVRSGVLPGAETFGACGVAYSPVFELLRKAVPLRGFRLPEVDDARLTRTDVKEGALVLHFAAGGAPPPGTFDEDLLLTIEGMRAFERGEQLLAEGNYTEAERYFVEKAEAPEAHPFAQERAIGLLAARTDAHDLALDLAAMLKERRPGAAAPYWAEAQIRLVRNQRRRAGELLQKLAELARQREQTASWFHASRAAGEAFGQENAFAASRALQDALAARPDDYPSLLKLAEVADQAKDFEGAVRAWRRIAALARDPAQAARAHVRLGDLLIRFDEDFAGARLHLDAALRLAPEDPDALLAMGELCARDGEALRAIRCLDLVREQGIARSDAALTARASLRAGRIWDEQIGHLANALLRLQEAADLAPEDVEIQYRLGDLYERNDRPAEAVEAYLRAVASARAAPLTDTSRDLAHRALHALSRLALERLDDATAAQAHLEAALELRPDDVEALRALLPVYRRTQRHADLARACARCAAASLDPVERGALLAEAGELHRERLGAPDEAQRLLELALLSDPQNRTAIEGLALLAEARGDGAALCRHLLRRIELARDDEEAAALLRRLLHAAREVADDLDLAADALGRLAALEPDDVSHLEALAALHRRRGDPTALAHTLERLASFQESEGKTDAAVRALRERANLLETRLGRPLDAIELLERALQLAPDDRAVLAELGEACLRNGRPEAAREALRALERNLPADERPWLQARLGRAADLLGERDEAIAAWLEASTAGALDEALLARFDTLLAQAGRERERAELLASRARRELDAGKPEVAAGIFAAAAALFERVNRPQQAQDAWEAVLEADRDGPYAPAALDALVDFAQRAENPLRAATLLAARAAFDATPREAARRLFRAASLAAELDAERRERLLAESVERDGGFAPARLALAALRLEGGDDAQALAHAEAALAVPESDDDRPSPGEIAALHKLCAEAATRLGDDAALRRHLAAWCESNPTDTESLLRLSALHRAAGDRHALLEVLRALADSGERRHAEAALRELAPLLDAEPARASEALSAWKRLGRMASREPAVLAGLATALGRAGETQERARVLTDLAELTPDGAEAGALLLEAADGWLASEKLDAAVAALKTAAERSPRPQRALERLADAARQQGDLSLELEALRRRTRLAVQEGESHAGALQIALGIRLLDLDAESEARDLLAGALLLSPPDEAKREALAALATLCERAGDLEEAAERLGQLAPMLDAGERATTLIRRARLLVELDRLEPAREALDAALAARPGDSEALHALKEVCARLGDDEGYAEILSALLVRARSRDEALGLALELGRVCRDRIGSDDRAELAWRRALSIDPSHAEALEALFELLVETGRTAEALPMGEKLARLETDARAAARRLLELSRLAQHEGERPLALRFARLAWERDATDAAVCGQLAEQLYLMGSTAEARALLGRLASQADFTEAPDEARATLLRYAELASEGGHPGPAIEALRRVLDHYPADAVAAEGLFELLLPADPDTAWDALARHAAALAPGRRARELYIRLAEDARTRRRDAAAAARFLEKARDLADDPLPMERSLLALHRESGDRAALARALASFAEHAEAVGETSQAREALDELAQLREQQDDVDGAATALEGSAKLLESMGDAAGSARRMRALGVLLRDRAGDANRAEAAFRRAVELFPGDLESAQLAAALIRKRGDAAGEAHLIERVLPALEDPQARADALLHLARLHADQLGSYSRAEAVLEQLLALRPQHEEARRRLEEIYQAQARWLELAASLERRAQTATSRDAQIELLRRAAKLYASEGRDPGRAARALLTARASAPDDLDLAEQCAQVLADAGRLDEAAQIDAEILVREPGRDAPFARQLAHLAAQDDREGRAALLERRAEFEAPRGEPTDPERAGRAARLLLEAATLRRDLGDARTAADDEVRAFSLDPLNEEGFTALLTRADATRDVTALAHVLLVRARAMPQEFVPLTRLRAEVLAADGRFAEAADALDEVLAAAPEDAEALSLRAEVAFELAGLAAAAPFDRMLLARAAHQRVPSQQLAQSHYRLGLLAKEDGAPELAADHLGEALKLLPEDPRADEALEALDQIHAALNDGEALHRVLLIRASRATDAAEKQMLLRRAADAAPGPQAALEALEELTRLAPEDASLQERLAEALEAGGRFEQLLMQLVRRAESIEEPARRSELLLRAAQIAETKLGDGLRARTLRARALTAAPESLDALRAALPDLRSAGDGAALVDALKRLIERSPDAEETTALQLELAQLVEASDADAAVDLYLEVVRRGASDRHFLEACERGLEACTRADRTSEAAEILELQADAESDPRRAMEQLMRAATLLDAHGAPVEEIAERLRRAAALVEEAPEPLAALAELYRREQDADACVAVLEQQLVRMPTEARPPVLAELASLYSRLGKREEAIESLRLAAELAPEDVELRVAFADLLESTRDAAAAFEALERARVLPGLDPERRDELDRRAAALARQLGRDEEEARIHRAVLARRPDDAESFAALRALLERNGARDELLQLLDRHEIALRVRGDEARSVRLSLLADRAALLRKLGREDEAEAVYRQALQLDSDFRPARRALRELVAERGEPAQLCRTLEADLEVEPDPAEAFELAMLLGETLLERLSDHERARSAFAQARELAGRLADEGRAAAAELALARALLAADEPAVARELLEHRIGATAEVSPELLRQAAEAAERLQDREAARGHLRSAWERTRDPELLVWMERLAREEGPTTWAEALELRASATEDEGERIELLRQIASLWAEVGDVERRLRALEAILDRAPLAEDAFEQCRALYREGGQFDRLASLLERRASQLIDPTEKARLLVELGELGRGPLGDPARAADWLEHALALDPSAPGAAEALAETSAELGNTGRAEELYRRLLRTGSRIPAPELQLRLAELLEQTDRVSEALTLLEHAARAQPGPGAAQDRLAALAARLTDAALALRAREVLLATAGAALPSPRRAAEHLEAARLCEALRRPVDAIRHYEATLSGGDPRPDALERLAELYVEAGRYADAATALARLAESVEDAEERAALHARRAALFEEKLGAPARALDAVQAALQDRPQDPELLVRGCRLAAATGEEALLVAWSRELERQGEGADVLRELAFPLGRALAACGEAAAALAHLLPALTDEFDVPMATLARDLAQQTGDHEARRALEQHLIAALPPQSSEEAAARLQALARELEPDRPLEAAELLEKAFALRPPDASDLLRQAALYERNPSTLDLAVRPLGALVLIDPADAALRGRLRRAAEAAGQRERARLLGSLEAYFDPGELAADEVGPLPVGAEARARLSDPLATSATAELLRLFAPALNAALDPIPVEGEPIGPFRATTLHSRVVEAQRAVGLEALEPLLAADRGMEVTIAPGSPDRLIIGLGAATGLDVGAMRHLLLRACELSASGASLLARDDAADLLPALLHLLGADVEMPAAWSGARERLEAAVAPLRHEGLAPLVARAAEERIGIDALRAALERSASRVALAIGGDAGASLRGELRLTEWREADPDAVDLLEALQSSEAMLDLVRLAAGEELARIRGDSEAG